MADWRRFEDEEEEMRRAEETERVGWGVDGGVVVSCNKFNLNPKLTRCCDCRVLKI